MIKFLKFIKLCSEYVSRLLSRIPDKFTTAKVIPIYRKGSQSMYKKKNFRLISTLLNVSKVFEASTNKRLRISF